MEEILNCKNCDLCKNQLPLLDNSNSKIMCVGLSAKKVNLKDDPPFSPNTNSGKIVELIEKELGYKLYRTNLVKCLPLNENEKLRYPNESEKEKCFKNLLYEFSEIKPLVVLLFGRIVSDFVLEKLGLENGKLDENFNYKLIKTRGMNFIVAHHPSYIYVYRKKEIEKYVKKITELINSKTICF
jgi:uracil-DNA glycosylase